MGNHDERTLEVISNLGRINRGGHYTESKSPSNRDYNRPTSTNDMNSSRLTIYIY